MKYELIIIAILLILAIVPVITTTIVYASEEAYPNWDEDRAECIANGGYWKHAFCVYD